MINTIKDMELDSVLKFRTIDAFYFIALCLILIRLEKYL